MLDPRPTRRQLRPKTRPSDRGRPRLGRGARPQHVSRATYGLLAVVMILIGLVAVSRFVEQTPDNPTEVSTLSVSVPAAESLQPAPPPPPSARPRVRPVLVAQPPTNTPTLDLMVRLEAQRRITRAGAAVYFDSLLAGQDSLLRRWVPRPGQPVTVALVRDSFFLAERVDERAIRNGFATWQELRTGIKFLFVEDATAPQVEIRWIELFAGDERRTGQTDLQFDSDGVIQHALVTLSIRDPEGVRLDQKALATTALHEVGHVLGLLHSERFGDIMFPAPTVPRLSDRDRRTLELIYSLPPGTIKTNQ